MFKESAENMKASRPIGFSKRSNDYLSIGIMITLASVMTAAAVAAVPGGGGEQLSMAQTTTDTPVSDDEASVTGISLFSREPPLNQTFAWQGHISSSPSELPERNDTHTAVVLNPRTDGGMYDGILTYHSTRPVQPVVWTVVAPDNATAAIPEEFGGMSEDRISLDGDAQIILSPVQEEESTSGSIVFVGDALEFVGEEGILDEPFIVTYSLTGQPTSRIIENDLESISGFNATETPEN